MGNHGRSSLFLDTWLLELVSLLLCIASLATILVLLACYNGKSALHWHNITLNALIAIFATLGRVMLAIAVSSAFGQFKWIWHFKGSKPLADFSLLDDASRGPWGGLRLLIKTKSLSLVAIGCWVTILAVAIDPFVQQIVAYEPSIVYSNSTNAKAPFGSRWSAGTVYTLDTVFNSAQGNNANPIPHLDFSMQAAVLFGMSANNAQITQQLPISCNSGNCEWEDYLSLAICSACNDVSSLLTKSESLGLPMTLDFPGEDSAAATGNITIFSLPNGASINNVDNYTEYVLGDSVGNAVMTAQAINDPTQSLTFQDNDTLLIAMSILRANPDNGTDFIDWPNFNVTAMECGLYLCVKQFTSNVTNGTTYEASKEVGWSRNPQSWEPATEQIANATSILPKTKALYNSSLYYERTDLQLLIPPPARLSNPMASVNISCDGVSSLVDYLNKTFNDGSFSNSGEDAGSNDSAIAYGITGMVKTTSYGTVKYSPSNMQALWNATSLPDMFDNLASSMTNNLRANADDTTRFPGREGNAVSFIKVRWAWMALPCACTALGIFFLATAIWETHKINLPLWKSSVLASLFHGFDGGLRVNSENRPLMSQMVDQADSMMVQLQPLSRGGYSLGGAILLHERQLD